MRLFAQVVLASLVASSAHSQTHVAGVIGGLSVSRERLASGLADPFLPDLGFSSTIELNPLLSIGTEARYVQRPRTPLTLSYVETPLFVRLSDSRPHLSVRTFVRAGVAPAIEVHCRLDGPPYRQNSPGGPNTPETGHADPVGFAYHPLPGQPDMTRHNECLRVRQRKLDFGWLSALGMTMRSHRREGSLELRVTHGVRNLAPFDESGVSGPFRSRTVSLLLTSATRQF